MRLRSYVGPTHLTLLSHLTPSLQGHMRCAAEHMSYSSLTGGFRWDVGRYDAFETIMEVTGRITYSFSGPVHSQCPVTPSCCLQMRQILIKLHYFHILQILRVRLLHPDVPPGNLTKLDGDFRAFMECREPGGTGRDDLAGEGVGDFIHPLPPALPPQSIASPDNVLH